MTPFRILKIEDKPERDPYRNDGSASRTTLNIDPQDRAVWVTQDYRTNSTPMTYWLNHRYALPIEGHPREQSIREWIEHETTQAALDAIAAGHSIEWDGHNQQGRLTDEARAELDAMEEELQGYFEGFVDNWEYWDAGEWIDEDLRAHVKASTTDEELERMAQEWETDAEAQGIVLSDSLIKHMRYYRDSTADDEEQPE